MGEGLVGRGGGSGERGREVRSEIGLLGGGRVVRGRCVKAGHCEKKDASVHASQR